MWQRTRRGIILVRRTTQFPVCEMTRRIRFFQGFNSFSSLLVSVNRTEVLYWIRRILALNDVFNEVSELLHSSNVKVKLWNHKCWTDSIFIFAQYICCSLFLYYFTLLNIFLFYCVKRESISRKCNRFNKVQRINLCEIYYAFPISLSRGF